MEPNQTKPNSVDLQSILYKSRSLLNNESPVNFNKLYADPKQLVDNSLKLSNKLSTKTNNDVPVISPAKAQETQPVLKESNAFSNFQKESKQPSFLIEDFLLQKRQEISHSNQGTSDSKDSEYDRNVLKDLAKNLKTASTSTGPAHNNFSNFFPPQASLKDISTSGTSAALPGTSSGASLSEVQSNDKYRQANISVISELNKHRKADKSYPIFSKLKEKCQDLPDSEKNFMTKAYDMLEFLSQNKTQVSGVIREKHVKQRQYADSYSNTTDAANLSSSFWADLTQSSKQYLQHEFYEYLVNTIQTYPKTALPGGISSRDDNIDAFIRIKFQNTSSAFILEKHTDSYIWAHLYFLLRSGFDQDACAYVSTYADVFNQSEKSFVGYFTAYMKSQQRVLPDDLKQHIDREFRIKSQHSTKTADPYKLALFQLIGKCDLTQWQPPILDTKEDYLWYNLHLLKDSSSNDSINNFTLYQLQNQIINLKSNYMTGPSAAFDYFKALVLLGLFEQAVNFIYSTEIPNAQAIHIATGLSYYGLLRTIPSPGNSDSLLQSTLSTDSTGAGIDQFDLIKAIVKFVTGFAIAHPEDATDYLYILGLDSRKEYVTSFHECLRELLIFTKAFDQLVGNISVEQIQTLGKLQNDWQLLHVTKPEQVSEEIIRITADLCIQKGLPCEAIRLYFLAKQNGALLELAASELSNILLNIRHILVYPAKLQEVNNFVESIKNILVTFSKSHLEENQKIVSSACKTLIDLRDSIVHYLNGQYSGCLTSMKASNILPIDANFKQINEYVKSSQKSHPIVLKHLPDAVYASMDSLYQCYLDVSRTNPQSEEIINIKLMSRNLMTFSALMQLTYPMQIHAKLNEFDLAMI